MRGGVCVLLKTGTLVMAVALTIGATAFHGQDSSTDAARRARSKVQPMYPELARKMNITGVVKVEVVIAPNGTIKEAKVVGGHPVLAGAAVEAVNKWRFEPAAAESTEVLDFKFETHQ